MRHLMPLLAVSAIVLSPAATQADLGDQLFKLLSDDDAGGDEFGYFVAINGATAIVGAWLDDDKDNGLRCGSAFLFDASTGQQIAKLLAKDGAPNDRLGRSVAICGAIAIVGAYLDDDACPENQHCNSGSAYLFDTSTGQQIAKLLAKDGAWNDKFGWSVAISGDTAIVGAGWDDDACSDDHPQCDSGSAYLFDVTTGQQTAKLLADDGQSSDIFGYSVAISGNTAIVGAWQDQTKHGASAGSAYLFDTTTGQQIAKLMPDDGATGDGFGLSVGIDGTTAIIGSIKDDDNGTDSGSAYLFDIATGKQIAKLLPDDGAAYHKFGESVGISGTTAIVGAYHGDGNNNDTGAAYLFDTTTGQQIAKLVAKDGEPQDWFGHSSAICGHTAIVGAPQRHGEYWDSGAAYLFEAADETTCPWDFDSDDYVGATDLALLLGSWGPYTGCVVDFDIDGEVGPKDLAILLKNWGPCP